MHEEFYSGLTVKEGEEEPTPELPINMPKVYLKRNLKMMQKAIQDSSGRLTQIFTTFLNSNHFQKIFSGIKNLKYSWEIGELMFFRSNDPPRDAFVL